MNARKMLVVTIAIILAGCSKQEAEISDWQQKEYNNYADKDESIEDYAPEDDSTENDVWYYVEDESEKWNPDYEVDDTKIIGL